MPIFKLFGKQNIKKILSKVKIFMNSSLFHDFDIIFTSIIKYYDKNIKWWIIHVEFHFQRVSSFGESLCLCLCLPAESDW